MSTGIEFKQARATEGTIAACDTSGFAARYAAEALLAAAHAVSVAVVGATVTVGEASSFRAPTARPDTADAMATILKRR